MAWHRALMVSVLVGVVVGGCTGGVDHTPLPTSPTGAGGTLRVGLFSGDDSISGWCTLLLCGKTYDPQSTSFVDVFELDRCCLMRTLLTYAGTSVADGGTELRPDLARSLPTISSDGLTWTFHLRTGVHYAPPMAGREIVAADLIRSIERTFTPASAAIPWANGGTIGGYWTDTYLANAIAGAHEFTDGRADHVSGLEAPDPHTLVIHLTEPTGDLGYRLALPQLGPIPPNPAHPEDQLGVAQGHDFDYGDVMVSSGPYMFEGSEKLAYDLPPQDQLPPAGDGFDRATLVRNSSWSRGSDPVRQAWPDRIEFSVVGSAGAAQRSIRDGSLDVILNWATDSATASTWLDDPSLRSRIDIAPTDGERLLFLNVAIPPLDDLHVRRAMNLAVDRQAVAADLGQGEGARRQEVFTHLALDSYEDNLLISYSPPGVTPTAHLAAARAEMAQSRYDTDHDGRCDAPACSGIDLIARRSSGPSVQAANALASQLRQIGLQVVLRTLSDDDFNDTYNTPGAHVELRMDNWFKDFPSASTFFPVLLEGDSDLNESMIGASPARLRKYGYEVRSVPNVDARINACEQVVFAAQIRCWAGLDQYLSEQVVPWIPLTQEVVGWLHSSRVRAFTVDASIGVPMPALDNVRVDGSPAPPAASVPASTPANSVPAIPDGVYRVSLTIDDVVGFGLPKDDFEDVGTFTVELNGGRFRWHQRGPKPIFNPIAVGRYEGTGNGVRFEEEQPYYNAAPLSSLTWRTDGDSLVFSLSKCTGPAAHDRFFCAFQKALFTAHPWQRVQEFSGGGF